VFLIKITCPSEEKRSGKIMPDKSYPQIFLLICLLCSAALGAFAQEESAPAKLAMEQALEREIKGGETHSFTLSLAAGQTARATVDQKGVDVSLAAFRLSGEKFIESESPSGLAGSDSILVTADGAGEYKIEVSPADPRAAAGKYSDQAGGN
jgi:hypothetical protein